MQPKIHILVKFVEGPWGGANQFLKALRGYFRRAGVYSENPEDAEVVLFNSYPFGSEYLFNIVFKLKKKPGKILIHRVDGPISYVRGRDKIIDEIIFEFNELFADGTIFISNLSRTDNYNLGMKRPRYETMILSAPDPSIFNLKHKRPFSKDKTKLIATSWSGNIRKGFDLYKFLDEHLDFDKYEMTFVGNSPVEFNNIKWLKPVSSRELANILKQHDIYITASKYEPFGQAVIEALNCGLPAVARIGGGYLETMCEAIEVFRNESDVINAIEKVVQNYDYYQRRINLPTLDHAGERHYEFAQTIYADYLNGNYYPKRANFFSRIKIRMKIMEWKTQNRLQSIIKGIKVGGLS